MKLVNFKFDLPEELIAQYPAEEKDLCRLMVVNRKTGEIEHKEFRDILGYYDEGDVLVLNNTKVFPAILRGNKEKTGAQIEVTLLRELSHQQKFWDVLVEPARKIRIGNKLYFGEDDSLVAEVIDNTTNRGRTLRFLFDGSYEEFKETLFNLGKTPLPSYITRDIEKEDADRYQTIYATREGAVMAPAAGIHFSRETLKRFEIKGCELANITLHSGLGNFRDIDVEDLTKHRPDSEPLQITEVNCDIINKATKSNKHILSVGATVLKSLEHCVSTDGMVKPFEGWTNKFIFPPYDFKVSDRYLTNFHIPYSTMLMQACAFGGYDLIMKAYKIAVKEKYQFGCFGDAMMII